MTRINTNVSSLVAQNRLNANNTDLQTSLTRLSTGLRINTGKDDPAGLIASEALRSDITGINKAISNTQRANQIIATADSALGQVSSLLNDVRGLVVEAANSGALSDDEIAANQLQVDSSLEAINRIAQTTTFQGRKLLDGSLDFVTSLGAVSSVTDSQIDQANLGATGSVNVDVEITTAATQATLSAGTSAFSAAAAANATNTVGVSTFTIGTGGNTIDVVGPGDITAVNVTSSDTGAAPALSQSGTTLTIAVDDDTNNTLTDIANAINGVDGYFASINGTATTAITAGSTPPVTASTAGIKVTANNTGAEYNNVTVEYAQGTSLAAAYDDVTKTLTVTLAAGDNTFTNIKGAIDGVLDSGGSQIFTATYTDDTGADIATQSNYDDLVLNLGEQTVTSQGTGTSGGQALNDDVVFQLSGSIGADTFNFEAGADINQIAAAINLVSDATNVTAAVSSGSLVYTSADYGSDSLIDIDVITEGTSGTFEAALTATRTNGTDVVASINGIQADGDANSLSINTSTLDLSLTVTEGSNQNFSFSITGGGALFQLGGDVVSNQQARLGISSLSTGKLGGASGRLYELGSGQAKALATDINGAGRVIDEVINKVTSLRGRLGAFQATTLESNLVALNETVANLTEAESSIRDADFAAESAALTRAQILVQSGTSVLGIANQNPQNVLSLLR